MRRHLPYLLLTALCLHQPSSAQPPSKDTVRVGIYITSIHDIDFKAQEYTISFWLWLRYRNRDLDFVNNLEIPNAKSVDKSFPIFDTTGADTYLQLKLQCVMKDSWKISNFPFDEQQLRLSIENSQFDTARMVFLPDTSGGHYDTEFALLGWNIDSCSTGAGYNTYYTDFGTGGGSNRQMVFSEFSTRLSISRDATGIFWKMFIGVYLAFLIAFICFFIHTDIVDARFALSVGSLFAVVGNKYIVTSSLPESSSFTLVDTLHDITLLFILIIITLNAYTLSLLKKARQAKAKKFDHAAAYAILASYILLNIWFVWQAKNS